MSDIDLIFRESCDYANIYGFIEEHRYTKHGRNEYAEIKIVEDFQQMLLK